MQESIAENALITATSDVSKYKIKVIIIDDDESLLKVIKLCLEMHGRFEVETANSAEEGIEKFKMARLMLLYRIMRCLGKMGFSSWKN